MSGVQRAAQIFGIIFVLVGIAGFVTSGTSMEADPEMAPHLLGLFPVNLVHNLAPVPANRPSGYGGIEWNAPGSAGLVWSCHFEANARIGVRGIEFTDATCVRVTNNYQYASTMKYIDTQFCLYQNNQHQRLSDESPMFTETPTGTLIREHNDDHAAV
jgi:hypothetical protein